MNITTTDLTVFGVGAVIILAVVLHRQKVERQQAEWEKLREATYRQYFIDHPPREQDLVRMTADAGGTRTYSDGGDEPPINFIGTAKPPKRPEKRR